MLRNAGRWLDPIILIGLFVSIAIPVWMVHAGQDSLSSFTVGLLATAITLLIDIIARISRTESVLLEANELGKLLDDKKLGAFMRTIKDSMVTLETYSFPFYRRIADNALEECQSQLTQLASGSAKVLQSSPYAYVFQGFKDSSKSVRTVQLWNMSFWRTNYARNVYFPQNVAAIDRGVQIVRIFAVTAEEQSAYRDVLQEQHQAGIHVYVTKPSRIDSEFVIFDDHILVDLDVDVDRDYRWERIVLDPSQVRRRKEQFDSLIERFCTRYPPDEADSQERALSSKVESTKATPAEQVGE